MKQERNLLALLATVQFTLVLDFVIMMPLGPQLMRAMHVTPQQFGLVVSAYTFSAALCGVLGALFIDRYDRRQALRWLYLGFALGTISCGLAPSYALLAAARAFTGCFGGILSTLVLSTVGDAVAEQRRGRALGVVMGAFSVASVAGVPLGLFLAARFSWHTPFLALGGFGVLLSLLIGRLMPSMRAHLAAEPVALRARLRQVAQFFAVPRQRHALLLSVILLAGHFSVLAFLSTYLTANAGFSATELGYVYLLGGGATVFSSPLIGRLADRLGKRRVFTVMALLVIGPIWSVTHLQHPALPLALLVTTLLFVVVTGRMIPAMALITSVVDARQRGSFLSINTALQHLSASLASYAAGLIITKAPDGTLLHYELVGYAAIGTTLLAIAVARLIPAPAAPADAAAAEAEPLEQLAAH